MMLYGRCESFHVYENGDGRSFHILVVDDTGGAIFCDGFQDREHRRMGRKTAQSSAQKPRVAA